VRGNELEIEKFGGQEGDNNWENYREFVNQLLEWERYGV